MNQLRILILFGLISLLLNLGSIPSAHAQSRAVIVPRTVIVPGKGVITFHEAVQGDDPKLAEKQDEEKKTAAAGEKPAEPAKADFDEDAVRLEKVLALTFDRSHSAILAAWAAEKLPERVDPPDEDAEPAEAKPEEKKEGEPATPDPQAALVAEKTKAIEEEMKTFGRTVTLKRLQSHCHSKHSRRWM
jgi:hypothetical protein